MGRVTTSTKQWSRVLGKSPTNTVGFSHSEIPYTDGFVRVTRTNSRAGKNLEGNKLSTYSIFYRIYNPTLIHSSNRAPLLVLHGGPGLPSEYLYPMVDNMHSSRSIMFYDQLGCGRSDQAPDVDWRSISESVDDLETLIDALQLRQFHLFGHSYGGNLAYEYIKRTCEKNAALASTSPPINDDTHDNLVKCSSLILSNVSTSNKVSNAERERLLYELKERHFRGSSLHEHFRKRYQCRTPRIPKPLLDAIQNAAPSFHDTHTIPNYVATPCSFGGAERLLPPVLLVRGEYDFVTKMCSSGWGGLFLDGQGFREEVMEGCAHYCLFEDGEKYGAVIEEFCFENDSRL